MVRLGWAPTNHSVETCEWMRSKLSFRKGTANIAVVPLNNYMVLFLWGLDFQPHWKIYKLLRFRAKRIFQWAPRLHQSIRCVLCQQKLDIRFQAKLVQPKLNLPLIVYYSELQRSQLPKHKNYSNRSRAKSRGRPCSQSHCIAWSSPSAIQRQ